MFVRQSDRRVAKTGTMQQDIGASTINDRQGSVVNHLVGQRCDGPPRASAVFEKLLEAVGVLKSEVRGILWRVQRLRHRVDGCREQGDAVFEQRDTRMGAKLNTREVKRQDV